MILPYVKRDLLCPAGGASVAAATSAAAKYLPYRVDNPGKSGPEKRLRYEFYLWKGKICYFAERCA
jgi:hypothetical protein